MNGDPNSIGLPYMVVTVDDVTGTVAAVLDQYGKRHDIRVDVRRGKGSIPRPGEVWLVDRTLGYWTFAASMVADPPAVTGTTTDPVVKSLVAALAAAGLITDETT